MSKALVLRIVGVICALIVLQQIWHWEIERREVPPGEFLVRIHRWGKNLDENTILAPDDSYKGIMFEVLPEGRHFLNPLFWSVEVHKVTDVPPGSCLVLTRMFGDDLPEGEILATQDPNDPIKGTRGILRDVLPPGRYRINPYAYKFRVVPAIQVGADEVGVRTLLVGKNPNGGEIENRKSPYVVPEGFRGVQETPASPGTYYINPYAETITPIEVRSHRVELRDIKFPSQDGFMLEPRVVVEYAVNPNTAPELLMRLTDGSELHQADATLQEQSLNEILQKVILPHIRGYARIEGSNFDARDFILASGPEGAPRQNAREALQHALFTKVQPKCEELGVLLRAVTLAALTPPKELAQQISERELARVELDKNAARIREYKAEQELKAKEALKDQATEKVKAETKRIQSQTQFEQLMEVAKSRLIQELQNAQLQLDASEKQAEAINAKGTAEAAVILATNEAEVAGIKTAISGFVSLEHFAEFQMLMKLSPSLTEIFASDESDFAKVFAEYMARPLGGITPPPRRSEAAELPPDRTNR